MKINIDGVDYQTDDFSERQKGIYQEMVQADKEMSSFQYLYRVLESRVKMLAAALAEPEPVLEAEVEEDSEVSSDG